MSINLPPGLEHALKPVLPDPRSTTDRRQNKHKLYKVVLVKYKVYIIDSVQVECKVFKFLC